MIGRVPETEAGGWFPPLPFLTPHVDTAIGVTIVGVTETIIGLNGGGTKTGEIATDRTAMATDDVIAMTGWSDQADEVGKRNRPSELSAKNQTMERQDGSTEMGNPVLGGMSCLFRILSHHV